MTVVGMLRVKDEARWIERCLASIRPLCASVIVFDDHSTDGTPDLCARMPGVTVYHSNFTGTNEARDKNFLLSVAEGRNPDWIIAIDGDEELDSWNALHLASAMQTSPFRCLSLPVWYLWDREDQIRTDGVYGNFRRESAFRPDGSRFHERSATSHNFHCGNVPPRIRESRGYAEAPLLHYGYLHREDRVRKYEWYNRIDPHNRGEDGYRHMVIGDLLPADTVGRHAGPLKLETVKQFSLSK